MMQPATSSISRPIGGGVNTSIAGSQAAASNKPPPAKTNLIANLDDLEDLN